MGTHISASFQNHQFLLLLLPIPFHFLSSFSMSSRTSLISFHICQQRPQILYSFSSPYVSSSVANFLVFVLQFLLYSQLLGMLIVFVIHVRFLSLKRLFLLFYQFVSVAILCFPCWWVPCSLFTNFFPSIPSNWRALSTVLCSSFLKGIFHPLWTRFIFLLFYWLI